MLIFQKDHSPTAVENSFPLCLLLKITAKCQVPGKHWALVFSVIWNQHPHHMKLSSTERKCFRLCNKHKEGLTLSLPSLLTYHANISTSVCLEYKNKESIRMEITNKCHAPLKDKLQKAKARQNYKPCVNLPCFNFAWFCKIQVGHPCPA